ncbi:MAG: hypothetical protein P1V34_13865 [Alphaproteobacteria bacterium]|nr:hypothetical protein [Alphaproteobacteria bacterium]
MQTPTAPPAGSVPVSTAGAASATPLPTGTATIPSLPPALLQSLQSGDSISAQVTAKPNAGQLTLTTQSGQTLTVQTNLALPTGTSLALTLQSLGTPTTLTLQPQSGNAMSTGSQQAATSQTGVPTTSAAPQSAVVTSQTQGLQLTGTIISAPTAQSTAQSAPQSLPQSTTQPSTTSATPASTGATSPASTVLPNGTLVQLRVLGIAPQGQTMPGTATATSFTGTVTGQSAGGATLVQSPSGTISIPLPNAPPAGTQLLLDMVGAPRLPPPGLTSADQGSARFQALQDAITLLRGTDPSAAQRLTQSLIPQPNGQLGLAVAFLAGSLRQGGVDRWLGSDISRSLKAADDAKSGTLSRLDRDMTQSQGRASDSAGQDWRVSTLPFMSNGQVEQIRLYIRDKPDQDSAEGDDGDEKQPKRFVIEADFSRLGPIQLDGLARKGQVDVMVRTQRALPPEARDDIRNLFADTITALGLTGRVDFMVVSKFDLVPDRNSHGPGPGGLTV